MQGRVEKILERMKKENCRMFCITRDCKNHDGEECGYNFVEIKEGKCVGYEVD